MNTNTNTFKKINNFNKDTKIFINYIGRCPSDIKYYQENINEFVSTTKCDIIKIDYTSELIIIFYKLLD